MSHLPLAGKVAYVIGATGGLGSAIVETMLGYGATVVGTGTKPEADAAVGYRYEQLQLGDKNSVERLCALIRAEEPDIIVNSAGISRPALLENIDLTDTLEVLQINLIAPMWICQAAIAGMKAKKWGRIVNITAISGQFGRVKRISTGTAKAALDVMTASLAIETGQYGILANSVSPGFINTKMTGAVIGDAGLAELSKDIPVNRLGGPAEVAELIAWLAGPANTYVTGQQIAVDGGFGRARLVAASRFAGI